MVKPIPMLADPSRPRLFDTIPRERLFAHLDSHQPLPGHTDRCAAGRGQDHAGSKLARESQAWRHLVPGGRRRRRSGHVLPFSRAGRTDTAGAPPEASAAAAADTRVPHGPGWIRTPLLPRAVRPSESAGCRGARQFPGSGRRRAAARRSAVRDRRSAAGGAPVSGQPPSTSRPLCAPRREPVDGARRLGGHQADRRRGRRDRRARHRAARRGGNGFAVRTLGRMGSGAGAASGAVSGAATRRESIGRSGLARAGLRLFHRTTLRSGAGRRSPDARRP